MKTPYIEFYMWANPNKGSYDWSVVKVLHESPLSRKVLILCSSEIENNCDNCDLRRSCSSFKQQGMTMMCSA